MSYDTIGSYTSGVWLIEKANKAAIVTRANLPAPGSGWQYYWLGSNVNQASSRAGGALQKLSIDSAGISPPGRQQISQAFHSGVYQLRVGEAGGGGVSTPALLGYGTAGIAAAAAVAGAFGTAATEGTTGGAASTAAVGASTLAKIAAGAGIAGLLTSGDFLLRAAKFIGGLLLAYIGLRQLAAAGSGSGQIVGPPRPRMAL